jgi:hypothetical protein
MRVAALDDYHQVLDVPGDPAIAHTGPVDVYAQKVRRIPQTDRAMRNGS